MKQFVLLGLLFSVAFGAYCHGKPDPVWQPNNNPIYSGDPTFIRSVKNGKLYKGGSGDFEFYIAHIWGSPYELGVAHGQLLRDEMIDFMTQLWVHLDQEFIDGPAWLPEWIQEDIAQVGLDAFLQLTAWATEEYTPSYWFQELQGIADGVNSSSVTYSSLLKLMMFGEATKGTCTMIGAWGDSIKGLNGTDLVQVRALDWDNTGPFPKYPAVIVYHPDEGHAFANIGWPGWIGSISGASSSQMAISEIGVYFPDDSFGEESRFGYPFTYVLRDILQFDNSVDDATNRLVSTSRTCNLLFGVGDGKEPAFRGFEYSYSTIKTFDDENLEPNNATWHPRIKDVVYWAMDWNCPGYNEVASTQIQNYYGNLSPENLIHNILPAVQTGNTHVAVYDLTKQFLYLANAGLENTPNRNAYQRPFTKLDLQKLWAETRP